MTPSDSIDLFIAILSAHKGLSRAISVADMAGQRQAQQIKALVVQQRKVPIGSSCGKSHGWYWIETEAEERATIGQYRNRVRSLCLAIANTTVASGEVPGVLRQMAMEFELEESHR